MARERNLTVRFSVQEKETLVNALRQAGDEGDRLAKRLTGSSKQTSGGLKAIDTASREVQGSLQGLAGRAGPLGNVLGALGPQGLIAAAGIGAVSIAVGKALSAFAEAEIASVKLDAVLRANGVTSREVAEDINRFANAIEQSTMFTAEQVQEAAAGLATFKSVSKDSFDDVIRLAGDMATVFGGDLSSASKSLGKALEDPVKAIAVLRRQGVILTDEQQALIKSFVELNDKAGAQAVIMDALQEKVGGTAEAVGKTLGGAFDNLTDAVGNSFENFGKFIAETFNLQENLQGLADWINNAFGEDTQAKIVGRYDELLEDRTKKAEGLKKLQDALGEDTRGFAEVYEKRIGKIKDQIKDIDKQIRDSAKAADIQIGPQLPEKKVDKEEESRAVIKAAEAHKKYREEREKATTAATKNDQAVKEYIESLGQEYKMLGLSNRERAVEESLIRASSAAKREGRELTKEEIEQIRQKQGAIFDLTEAQRGLGKQTDANAEIFKEFSRDVYTTFTNSFERAMNGTLNDFGDFADEAERIVIRMLANMATAAFAQPIIVPVIQTVGSAIGLDNATIQGVTGQFGGGGSGVSASDAAGLLNIGSLNKPLLPAGGTFSGYIDDLGAALGLPGANAVGPFMPGAGPLSTRFTGATSLASLGAGFAANLLFGDRGIGADIGGTIGGLAAAGLGLGPVGAALGTVAGNLIGGLFGGKSRPHPTSNTGASGFDASGSLIDPKFSSKHLSDEFARAMAVQLSTLGTSLSSSTGLDFSVIKSVQAGTDDGRGFLSLGDYSKWDSNTITFDPKDQAALQKALAQFGIMMVQRVEDITGEVDDKLLGMLKNIKLEGREAKDVIADIDFVLGFEKLFADVKKPLSATEQAVQQLNAVFDEYVKRAKELGFALEDVNRLEAARVDGVQKLLTEYRNTNLIGVLGEKLSPGLAAITQELQRYDAEVKNLQALGATTEDYNRAQMIHQLNLNDLTVRNSVVQRQMAEKERQRLQTAQQLSSRFESIVGTFDNLLFDLQFGKYTVNSPVENLDALRGQVQLYGNKARLGDVDAADKLAQLVPSFLDLSGSINGYNEQFAKDQALALGLATETKSVAQRQLEIQADIAAKAQKQIDAIGSLSTSLQVTAINSTKLPNYAGGSFSANNPNEVLIRNRDAIEKAGLTQTMQALLFQYAPGVLAGEGRRSLFFEQNPEASSALTAVLKQLGFPGFAAGGLIRGGIAGQDSVPLLAMDGEYILNRSAVQRVGVARLDDINQGRAVANDNGSGLSGLRADIQRLTDVLIAVGEGTLDGQSAIVSAVRGLAESPRVKALA